MAKKKGKKKKVKKNNVQLLLAAIIIGVISSIIFIVISNIQVEKNKKPLINPLEKNAIIVPIVARALVLGINRGYITAIENIKSNYDYIKNKFSAEMTIAELYARGFENINEAEARYKKLYESYQNQQFVHNNIFYVNGIITNQRLYLMSNPEVLMRLAQIAIKNAEKPKARELYKKIMKRYKESKYDEARNGKYEYKELAKYNLKAINSSEYEIRNTYEEYFRLKAFENAFILFIKAYRANDLAMLNRIMNKNVILSKQDKASEIEIQKLAREEKDNKIIEKMITMYEQNQNRIEFKFKGFSKDRLEYQLCINSKKKRVGEIKFTNIDNNWFITSIGQL